MSHPLINVPVKRHPKDELVGGNAAVPIRGNAVVYAVLILRRILSGRIQRGVEIGVAVPGAMYVIGHDK